jgi:glucosyl-dolichyl phosphate glucuronosyltransferase
MHPRQTSRPRGSGTGLSIIICTFNRLPLLRRMLDSITSQLPIPGPLEVIVVDNNSSDDTAGHVQRQREQFPELVYVLEPRQGLSWARNAGAAAATQEYLLYLDDDAYLPSHYLQTVMRMLDAEQPDIFGGPIFPDYADPKPRWFPESLELRKKANISGFYNDVTISGGNFGMRASIHAAISGFNPEFGMSGLRVGMLEERIAVETYRRITPAEQQRLYYCVEAFIYHHTPARRMQLGFQLRRTYIGNYQLTHFFLKQGVRRTDILFHILRRRVQSEIPKFCRSCMAALASGGRRLDELFLALVRLGYRLADLHAITEFLLARTGTTARVPNTESRPLVLLVLRGHRAASAGGHGAATAGAMDSALECLAGLTKMSVQWTDRSKSDQIRTLVYQSNVRSIDAVLTDHAKTAQALWVVRGNFPHLQVIYLAHELAPTPVAGGPGSWWAMKRRKLEAVLALRRLRRVVDEIVLPDRLPETLFNRWIMRRLRIRTAASVPALWQAVTRESLSWSPLRLRV